MRAFGASGAHDMQGLRSAVTITRTRDRVRALYLCRNRASTDIYVDLPGWR